jgi:hypothetical protein
MSCAVDQSQPTRAVVKRLHQSILIGSTILGSWLGMQAVHEAGHVLGAWLTGGQVVKVVLHPLTISRTEMAPNPCPLAVVWAGPLVGVLLPLLAWATVAALGMPGAYVLRFFAGFCLLANGAYLAVGSFDHIGDCGVLLQHGARMWPLWLFGAVAMPLGLGLWHRQGPHFGLGAARGQVSPGVAYATLGACLLLLFQALVVDGE